MRNIIKFILKRPLLLFSVSYLVFLTFISIFVPFIANEKPIIWKTKDGKIYTLFSKKEYDPKNTTFKIIPIIKYSPNTYNLNEILKPPSKKHLFGTDDRGRDVFTRILYGARVSMFVGFVAVFISIIIGTTLGAISGYYGGKVDFIILRLIEIMMTFPTIFLILSIIAFVGPSILNIMLVIGFTGWSSIARLIRGEVLKIKTYEFITAAKALGFSDKRIIFFHILPNTLTIILVYSTFAIAGAILAESTLSFLGLGVQPPTPSWGAMLNTGKNYIIEAPWLIIFPGLFIFLTVTSYNIIGDTLQEVLNPKKL